MASALAHTSYNTAPEQTHVAEDRKEPPFEGGSQPVSHQKDPVPGPGRSVAQVLTLIVSVLVVAACVLYFFAR
jgi:hypothetical protein